MATWPNTLPQQLLTADFQDTEPDLVVQEQMDLGPPILRRRATANLRPFSGCMKLTPAQKVTLRAFYRTYCASEFTFPDPDSSTPITVIFLDKPVYGDLSGVFQKVTLKLGEMP